MSQRDFREFFLEDTLDFLWRQWSALGVLSETRLGNPWAIDPEPLLLFSLQMGRYEPRLFDEVVDWLVVNGRWIDLQRLRAILRGGLPSGNIMGAVAAFLVREGSERKWRNLAQFCKSQILEALLPVKSLFYHRDGRPYPVSERPDPSFLAYGLNRPKLTGRRLTREVSINSQSTIRFLLRALFGVGARAECLIYLLTHVGGHPSEVARAIGLSVPGAQDALMDLSRSGLVLTRVRGKRKIEYWLSHERWWGFLSSGSAPEEKAPIWIDWISLYSALSQVWIALNELNKEGISDYMRSSRLRDSLEAVGNEFAKSGLDLPPIPGRGVAPNEYEKAFEGFIGKVFGAM